MARKADKFTMKKSDFHILIVDDDQAMGKAMAEVLSRSGYKVTHVLKPDEALAIVKIQAVHAAVIDCMLPKMNGRDLAKKIREEGLKDLPIFFVSGIYKDRSFAREAMQSVGAVAFITKPFEVDAFVKEVEGGLRNVTEVPMAPLESFMAKQDLTYREVISAVNETEQFHGYDLPWIYSLLMRPRISGVLSVTSAEGRHCSISFQEGNVVQVAQKDARSFFGVLLVERGFISQADLDEAVKSSGGANKKLGELLIEANVLSPHAIEIVMADQHGIRLSQTINDTSVKVNFVEKSDFQDTVSIDRHAYTDLLSEWVTSKISSDWLKKAYMPWLNHPVRKGPEFSVHHRALKTAGVEKVDGFMQKLLDSDSLEAALAGFPSHSEDHLYAALHCLVVSRVIRFEETASQMASDFTAQKTRLEKLVATLDKQSHFERLALSPKAKDAEIKRAYLELAKILHPDKLAPSAPDDVRTLSKQAFEKINTAYQVLSDTAKRDEYLQELEKGRADAILEAEQLSEQARTLLSKGDVRKAKDLLEQAVQLAPPTSDTRLRLMWARLKTPGIERDKKQLDAIKEEQHKIPPEDRHDAVYYFVKALLNRALGEKEMAKKNLEHVVAMAPDFIDARRELSSLGQAAKPEKPKDLLNADLKDVVGMFFKKKK